MLTVGQKIPEFSVVTVKPGFNHHEEHGESAFELITEQSFPGKWKVLYFYPKDFTFVCPTEIVEFAKKTGNDTVKIPSYRKVNKITNKNLKNFEGKNGKQYFKKIEFIECN